MASVAWGIFVLGLLAGSCVAQTYTTFQHQYFIVNRTSNSVDYALSQPADKQCTAIYTVNLRPEYTTQGNDIGMLQPHGANTQGIAGKWPNGTWVDVPVSVQIGADYTNYPNPNDNVEQNLAQSMFSVKALIDPAGTPLGFKMDVMHMYYSVCVAVRGVNNRWVEVMAQTPQPDRRICVSDWRPDSSGRPNLQQNPFVASCGQGHIYSCRQSPNEQTGSSPSNPSGFADNMNIRFYCETCEDETFTFYWRVVASQFPPVSTANGWVQPDGENFCLWRKGDDYPSSLLQPYPANYVPPPVFELLTSSTMSLVVSAWALVALALLPFLL